MKALQINRIRTVNIVLIFLLAFTFLFSSVVVAEQRKKKYKVTCQSVIFSDSTRIKRLYGKGVHNRILPASTAKVMTALLVIEKLPLDKYITVSKNATLVQPTMINVKPGEQYKVEDLLYAILIKSANDASVVLAEAVSGSEANFVQLMNQRAKQLGAKRTNFANSNGLPSKAKQYSTAYDMYLIFRKALKYSFFRKAIELKNKTIQSKEGRQIVLTSHNKILFKGWKRKIYGKTGYTRAAQACFIGTLKKGNSDLIIGVFGCPNRWEDIKHVVSTYGKIPL
ncbi:MAG: serine hydrolase [Candidatus Omnitrophica bacterium]|nr:serine hydrolase [Candidatus Omnitrophota bacterium]MBU1997739.1 serine hydrolase [Candidatus Omnitrophota bacterium]MBU4333652.1 serine hydrolase [Candidatus Omnitrophota bacterium]